MVIKLEGINKNIGSKKIINNLSLNIEKGEVFALLGPNGAGKTTLIRIILGLLRPDSGQVTISNEKLTESSRVELLTTIGVQNDGNLYENLTVRENLSIWGEVYRLGKPTIQKRLEDVSEMFRLKEYLDTPVGSLSKGNRQKVLLARAIFHSPDILILDEPTTGLDPEAIDEFYSYIKKLKRDNVTIIMCTHYLYGMDDIVDCIGVLSQGELLASGKIDDLRKQERKVKFFGKFHKSDILNISEFGQITGNMESEFEISLNRYEVVSDVAKVILSGDNEIFEIHKQVESLKDIYFKIIEGE